MQKPEALRPPLSCVCCLCVVGGRIMMPGGISVAWCLSLRTISCTQSSMFTLHMCTGEDNAAAAWLSCCCCCTPRPCRRVRPTSNVRRSLPCLVFALAIALQFKPSHHRQHPHSSTLTCVQVAGASVEPPTAFSCRRWREISASYPGPSLSAARPRSPVLVQPATSLSFRP